MYNKLDEYLVEFSDENTSDDYWYDVGFEYACQLLNEFKEEDWSKLIKRIDEKNIIWKKRLVYCFGDNKRDEEMNIILKLIDTKDEELFVMCIDALCEIIGKDNKSKIASNQVIERVLQIIPESGLATKKVLERFIQQIN